jgi:dTDP-glucose 4,6-dehydratase
MDHNNQKFGTTPPLEMPSPTIMVAGGAGFIGSNFIQSWLEEASGSVVTIDKGTYAAGAGNLTGLSEDRRHRMVAGDIVDRVLIRELLQHHQPVAVINFAAETHVDRSILFPEEFVQANVMGTFNLLDEARHYWSALPDAQKDSFRFLQVSTDEVYGSLPLEDEPCDEERNSAPNSPYAASKAAADQFVRAFHQTYGLPAQIARCCNNYGPYQHPEKLIPHMIHRALREQPLPVYGDGRQIRDWLYVGDHCAALRCVIARGRPGEVYNISSRAERTNLQVVSALCALLDREYPRKAGSYADLIAHVADRPGHDRRYALDSGKLEAELGWRARESFESGLEKTVRWYLSNLAWVSTVADGRAYQDWESINYSQRR